MHGPMYIKYVNKTVVALNLSFKILVHLMVQEIQYLISQYRITYKYFQPYSVKDVSAYKLLLTQSC